MIFPYFQTMSKVVWLAMTMKVIETRERKKSKNLVSISKTTSSSKVEGSEMDPGENITVWEVQDCLDGPRMGG